MSTSTRILALLAAFVLLGAGMVEAWRGLAVSNRQKLRNLETWNGLDEAEREHWRAEFEALSARSHDDQTRIYRRHAALNRMRQDMLRVLDRSPTRAEVEQQLAGLPERMAFELELPGASVEELHAALTERIAGRLGAFLDNLVRADVITSRERDELDAQAFDERVDASLMLQKRQEIYLFVERHAPDEGEELLELRDLDPLDVSERLRVLRQNQGLLGRAGRELALSEEELDELAAAPGDQVMRMLARLYRPRIRLLLEERGKDPAAIDNLLAQPPRQLERVLNRLLSEQP